jgi:hypothetical protein
LIFSATPETIGLGALPSNPIDIVLQSGSINITSNSFNPKLMPGDSITNVYAAFLEDYAAFRKIGNNCCVITVAPGYIINDGNHGKNYIVDIQTAPGSISLPKTANSGTADYASSAKQGPPWTNGRNASGENKLGALAYTPDTKSWDITDVTHRRMVISCSIFGQSANTEVCGRRISQKSSLAETRSYQPIIEFIKN